MNTETAARSNALIIQDSYDGHIQTISKEAEETGDSQPVSEPDPQPSVHRERTVQVEPAGNLHPGISKTEVEQLIRHYSQAAGVDENLMLRIAMCESGLRWDAKNPTSTASGVFQYLAGTWRNTSEGRKGTSAFDADANIRMAVGHVAVHGTGAWNASISCWNK